MSPTKNLVGPLRVGMVLDQPFPPDARVEREAQALVNAGYEVHLLCVLPPDKPLSEGVPPTLRDENYQGIWVHRVDPLLVTHRIPVLNLNSRWAFKGLIKTLFWNIGTIDIAWQTLISRFVKRFDIDILHIHDLRLVPTGLSVATKYKVPLVADLHENYPALIEMLKGRNNPKKGDRHRKRWERVERQCAKQASHIITVAEESKKRLIEYYGSGVPNLAKKISVVANAVDIRKFQDVPPNPDINRRYKAKFVLTYVGHVNAYHRGIQTVLEALPLIRNQIPNIHFIAAGSLREAYKAELDPVIEAGKIQDIVEFTGHLTEAEFVDYIKASDICLCPHIMNEQTNSGIPNKVFLYHLFGKPIIVSSCLPLQRYVEETQGGKVFEAENHKDLAAKILTLYADESQRKSLGENGRQAVLNTHNWSVSSQTLIQLYSHLPYHSFWHGLEHL